ncbi:MAG TPA: chemotaxis protein CheD [bacterium]|nr:chemotaxis protein CheD [bacterium]
MIYGLGSCVGVALYDPAVRSGGLAHVMLPSSRLSSKVHLPGKFADTAVPALVEGLLRQGAVRERLVAKLVGGANMFSFLPQATVSIGVRNAAAVREKLTEMGIPILAERTGGDQGRTILFDLKDGRLEIRRLNRSSEWI